MIKNLINKLKFIELVDEMKTIERATILRNGRHENNAEHSYHLAMIVSIFLEDFPELDGEKCLKMALYHDLVEIFAGDTVIFDAEMEKTKAEREAKALLQLEQVMGESDFKNMKDLILEFDAYITPEAQFVCQVDKFHPLIQTVMQGGKTWHEYKMSKNKLLEKKRSQIDSKFGFDKILEHYLDIAEKEGMFYEGE